jgi:hypothetical protein
MLDAETRELIDTAKARRQIELTARFVDDSPAAEKPDPRAEERRAQVWADMAAEIAEAVRGYEAEGLKVLRHLKTRPEMVITGPVATWRRFVEEKRVLVGGRSVEFRHYVQPWSHGLPGFPE